MKYRPSSKRTSAFPATYVTAETPARVRIGLTILEMANRSAVLEEGVHSVFAFRPAKEKAPSFLDGGYSDGRRHVHS